MKKGEIWICKFDDVTVFPDVQSYGDIHLIKKGEEVRIIKTSADMEEYKEHDEIYLRAPGVYFWFPRKLFLKCFEYHSES